MTKQRRIPKARNKHLNDILMAKSKRSGKHADRRKKVQDKQVRKALKEY